MDNRKLLTVFLSILSYSTFVFGQPLGKDDYIFITHEELQSKSEYIKMELKGSRDFLSVFKLESSSEDKVIYFDPFENTLYRETTEGLTEVASIRIYEEYAEITGDEETICVVPSEEYELTLVRSECDS